MPCRGWVRQGVLKDLLLAALSFTLILLVVAASPWGDGWRLVGVRVGERTGVKGSGEADGGMLEKRMEGESGEKGEREEVVEKRWIVESTKVRLWIGENCS